MRIQVPVKVLALVRISVPGPLKITPSAVSELALRDDRRLLICICEKPATHRM